MLNKLSRKIMLSIADNKKVRRMVEKYGMAGSTGFARRFIAGETLEEAIENTKKLNKLGIKATLDLLGENVNDVEDSYKARDVFLGMLDAIQESGVDANISCKLTQMGLDLGDSIVIKNMTEILDRAKKYNTFVRVDMEGSYYTQKTLDVFEYLYKNVSNEVGIVLQSYLYRTESDVRSINKLGARVRICKGAYREPEIVAFQKKAMTDLNYVNCTDLLLTDGNYPGIATHDEAIITHVKEFAEKNEISPDKFEFQMLFGIRRDLQVKLVEEGYNVRVYVAFGTEWFPYYSRRLGESIGNVMFILKSLYLDSSNDKDTI